MSKPVVAVTMGDPAGIGPELIVKVLSQEATYQACRPLLIASPVAMRTATGLLGSALRFRPIASAADAAFTPGEVDLLCPAGVPSDDVVAGKLDPANGRAAALCLAAAYELVAAGQVDGVVAAPMSKQAFHEAGYNYFDELEYLADLTKSPDAYMLGAIGPTLWTISVTAHVPFARIAGLITRDRVLTSIRRLDDALRRVGVASPRLAVTALNVHGGEGGLFGREEIDEIEPAIEAARQLGVRASGPCPADTVFVRARAGEFDGVVCMYHDHANTGRKLLATMAGATVYMGLPAVCCTTAHGTAFDKAGQGVASPNSLADALKYAALLSR